MKRPDGRALDELRAIEIVPDYLRPNTTLISYGETKVICYASIEGRVPPFMLGSGGGWLTAEYGMLPGSTEDRTSREKAQGGRTYEIQRLIGRALRSAVQLDKIGPITIKIDCDVIKADGGTRTASITGAYVSLVSLVKENRRRFEGQPLIGPVAAVSVGIVNGQVLLDLCYAEDKDAQVDCNVVGDSNGDLIEFQATAEDGAFTPNQLAQMLSMAQKGLAEITALQEKIAPLPYR
jgi:ribonuclease PH